LCMFNWDTESIAKTNQGAGFSTDLQKISEKAVVCPSPWSVFPARPLRCARVRDVKTQGERLERHQIPGVDIEFYIGVL
jgi:hypothetical protein